MAAGPVPKVGRIAGHLRRMILAGELKEGMPLRQVMLSRRFGTSTIPLREAIRQLESEGLVTCQSYRGAVVAPLDPMEFIVLMRIRLALEREALTFALPCHTAMSLERSRRLLRETAAERDILRQLDKYCDFLASLYEPGVHPLMVAEIIKAARRSQRYIALDDEIQQALPVGIPRFARIFDAIENRDLETAQADLGLLYQHS
ncbi:MAG TPA: GntR family transcriptional regulator, partial [Holophaga sp.]|nr:GntR family transcriptional regulator [Holophaga sp.]